MRKRNGIIWVILILLVCLTVPAMAQEALGAEGVEKVSRPIWIVISIGLLFLGISVIYTLFPGTVSPIINAYFDNTTFKTITKGDNPFNSWPATILYVLLGLGIGMFIFLGVPSLSINLLTIEGPGLFLLLSLIVILLFTCKIALVQLLSFVFDLGNLLRPYIRVLFLAYFNSAFIFLFTALIISLLPVKNTGVMIAVSLVIAGAFLLFRLGSVVLDLLGAYRFPIFYLIVYLCTLEIAPILILIKLVNR